MKRILLGLVGASVFLSVWGGLHFFVWARLARDTGVPGWASAALAVLMAVMAFSPIASRLVPMPEAAWKASFAWIGVVGLTFVALLVGDVVSLLIRPAFADALAGADPSLFAARIQASLALATSLTMSWRAFTNAAAEPPIKHVEITLDRLPPAFDGFKIVQISDLHVSPDMPREKVQALVDRTNALKPDLVALTGDLVDGSVPQLEHRIAPMSQLTAPHGVFFCTGNHEYYSNADRWIAHYKRLGFRVLQNERVAVEKDGATIDVAGVPDWRAAGWGGDHVPRLKDTLAGRDASRELLLLAHQPRQFPEAAKLDVGLQLSGHTHGGQVWPFTMMVSLVEPYPAGTYRTGRSQLYVSRGTGFWGPAMRLLAPHELTVVTLRAKKAQ